MKFFPNKSPIGRRFGIPAETTGDIEMVGVLRDVHCDGLRRSACAARVYVPYEQRQPDGLIFTVRTARKSCNPGDPRRCVAR